MSDETKKNPREKLYRVVRDDMRKSVWTGLAVSTDDAIKKVLNQVPEMNRIAPPLFTEGRYSAREIPEPKKMSRKAKRKS